MHAQAEYGLLVTLHPADEVARLRVEALDRAVDARHQVLGLALEIVGDGGARDAHAVEAHVAVVVQVEHVDGAVQIACQKAIAESIEAQMSEADVLGGQRQLVAHRVLDVEEQTERRKKTTSK